MISGFNTDIEFDGVVYHVQTEDKGLSTKKIISLVYDRGTILASKRTPYDDLTVSGFDERILAERVQKQHKLICAAVKAGRIAELKEMTAKAAVAQEEAVAAIASGVPAAFAGSVGGVADQYDTSDLVPYSHVELMPEMPTAGPILAEDFPEAETFGVEPIIDVVAVVEDDHMLPAEAVAVVSELSGQERSSNSKLGVELLGDFKFKGGDRMTVNIMVCRGTERKVVADAQIMVKALGSSFRPVIFHAKSDANGLAKVHLQLPHFQAGRAALLIRAMDRGEEIELRRAVSPG